MALFTSLKIEIYSRRNGLLLSAMPAPKAGENHIGGVVQASDQPETEVSFGIVRLCKSWMATNCMIPAIMEPLSSQK
jgi:hypothetical protein